MHEGQVQIGEREVDGVLVLSIRMSPGQRGAIEGFHQLICDRVNAGVTRFVVNLEQCSWIDSKGLGELARALVTVMRHGAGLKLAGPPERLKAIFEMTNLAQIFEVFSTEAEALQSYEVKAN